ncbi:MAG: heat-inducible transcriptional repressor HrcA [Nitrospinota bacterium]
MRTIDERKREVLLAVIENHIKAPVPVGSKTISSEKLSKLRLSPATIRNTMAELDEMGYITQPHTSAGRLPTDKGYRYFVDELMTARKLAKKDKIKIDKILQSETARADGLLEATSTIISTFSSNAALVMLPNISDVVVSRFYFLGVSPLQIQVVLKTSVGRVINLIVEPDEEWSEPELTELSNFMNREYTGQSLRRIRQNLKKKIIREKAQIKRLKARALALQDMLVKQRGGEELIISGVTKFFDQPEFKKDSGKLKILFNALAEKKRLIELLDKCLSSEKVEVNIGSELGYDGFRECSLVTANCGHDSNWDGALGVIGPRRMDYAYIFSLLEYLTGALEKISLQS